MTSFKVKIKQSGMKSEEYFYNVKHIFNYETIKRLADDSLSDFKEASPTNEIETGWYYNLDISKNKCIIDFCNNCIKGQSNIAVIVDVGHATIDGKMDIWKNYLKEPIKKTYERINKMLQEVK